MSTLSYLLKTPLYTRRHACAHAFTWLLFRIQSLRQVRKTNADNVAYFTFMLPWIVKDFYLNNQTDALIILIYSVIKLCMFRASSLPIIRSLLLYKYIRHW